MIYRPVSIGSGPVRMRPILILNWTKPEAAWIKGMKAKALILNCVIILLVRLVTHIVWAECVWRGSIGK